MECNDDNAGYNIADYISKNQIEDDDLSNRGQAMNVNVTPNADMGAASAI